MKKALRLLGRINIRPYKDIKPAIKDFSSAPFKSIAYLLTAVAMMVFHITFIYALVKFASDGGFAEQVDRLRQDGLFTLLDYVTGGTVNLFYYGIGKYEGTYIVTASDEMAARKKAFSLLYDEIRKILGHSLVGEFCLNSDYEVKEL